MRKIINKLLCSLFGHEWVYNHPWLPNKSICTRCKIKAEFDLHYLDWDQVENFENEKRTDEELIKQWIRK